jgi:hypothetical protein
VKYTRGTYLRWTTKALDPKREGSSQRSLDDRMILLSHNEVAFVHAGVVEQLDMYKTVDSYVRLAPYTTLDGTLTTQAPRGLKVDRAEVKRCSADALVKEFGFVLTKRYEGRRYGPGGMDLQGRD